MSRDEIVKCGETFFQPPTATLSRDIGAAVASRVGCDPAAAVSSAMMNLKGFSPACFRCYIRGTHPSGAGDWRECCCRAPPHTMFVRTC